MAVEFKPVYDFALEQEFCLYQGDMIFHAEDNQEQVNGKIVLRFLPKPATRFIFELKNGHLLNNNPETWLEINGQKLTGFIVKNPSLAGQFKVIEWTTELSPFAVKGRDSDQLSEVIFHVFNFGGLVTSNTFIGKHETSSRRIDQLVCEYDDWLFELKNLPTTSKTLEGFRNGVSSGLTQVARISKKDGKKFTVEEAKSFITKIGFFLSFVKGHRCMAVCPVGFDADGNQAWIEFNAPSEPYSKPLGWFSFQKADCLSELFPAFMEKLHSEVWQHSLAEAVSWYLNANNPSKGTEPAIILAQTAIELLSYEYVVNDKKMITGKGFKDLWASDKFRLLLSTLSIPNQLENSNLEQIAKSHKWLDLAHAVTEIRNSIVHPDHKKRGQFDEVLFPVWNHSMQLIEFIILAMCDYQGVYHNRLISGQWEGDVSSVPWSKTHE